jgi:hypothetical protein
MSILILMETGHVFGRFQTPIPELARMPHLKGVKDNFLLKMSITDYIQKYAFEIYQYVISSLC